VFAAGGDGWLESTPPVLTAFQARAGQRFVQAFGVAALREDSLARQRSLVERLSDRGIVAVGGTTSRGAFVVVPFDDAPEGAAAQVSDALGARGVRADARGSFLRLCPDVLTSADDIERAAGELRAVLAAMRVRGAA
jgi:kynureninase